MTLLLVLDWHIAMQGFVPRTVVALALVGLGACSPAAPSGTTPVAAITILGTGGTPSVAIRGFTPLTFVGTESAGQGLHYSWDFGDGASSTEPVAAHVSNAHGLRTATLTVTDRLGRRASASAAYYVGDIVPGTLGWWQGQVPGNDLIRLYGVVRDGATLAGTYSELPANGGVSRPFTGTLSGLNTITIRTLDGVVELTGTMEWRDGRPDENAPHVGPGLRLTARGGKAHGLTLYFSYNDPY
jgi:hypothetical protein